MSTGVALGTVDVHAKTTARDFGPLHAVARVAWIACDNDGCAAYILHVDDGERWTVRDVAREQEWDVNNDGKDYCAGCAL